MSEKYEVLNRKNGEKVGVINIPSNTRNPQKGDLISLNNKRYEIKEFEYSDNAVAIITTEKTKPKAPKGRNIE